MQQGDMQPATATDMQPGVDVTDTPPPIQVLQNSENTQPPEMPPGQEQVQESVDVKPVVAEEKKDPVRDALVKQLEEIKQQTKVVEDALNETNPAAGGGMMKKRKKTFYKRYKSKKSMKRKNKTNRNEKIKQIETNK
jgi:hypothetical protein